MRWSYNLERSRPVAIWLFAVAAFVVAILVVGGMTRLTGSGLSITDWRPINGVVPPLNEHAWALEFANYQRIPQYQLINRGMSLTAFQSIFWWEWAHRLLARLVGLVFFGPMVVFLMLGRLPARLIWRCLVILGLGALQGFVGWWMVASGLSVRTSVAPERLAVHLGLALLLFSACVWSGYDAWSGRKRTGALAAAPWWWAAPLLAALVYLQCVLGALVAGNRAGLVDEDWPAMGGRFVPEGYRLPGQGLWTAWLHSPPAVQFNHRMVGYLVFLAALILVAVSYRDPAAPPTMRRWSHALAGAVLLQIGLGVSTLWSGDSLALAAMHQLGAVGVLTLALTLAWRAQRP